MGFFKDAFSALTEEEQESFYRTVFLCDPSERAAALRNEYYKGLLGKMGEGVKIGAGVKLSGAQRIFLGDRVTLGDGATLIARPGTTIEIADGVRLNERVYLDTEREGGYIKIANCVYIGTGTTLFGHRGLEIGDHSLLAQNITLTPYSHLYSDPDADIITQGGHCEKVTIGRDVYIGMGVCVMYSGSIGDGSVVGAGSVVVKPIPPYSVAVGCPARVIKKR